MTSKGYMHCEKCGVQWWLGSGHAEAWEPQCRCKNTDGCTCIAPKTHKSPMEISSTLEKLRAELLQLDDQVARQIQWLENMIYELNPGITVPLGPDYAWDKLNGKWQLITVDEEESVPLSKTPRRERAEFVQAWTQETVQAAITESLKVNIAHRKSVLGLEDS